MQFSKLSEKLKRKPPLVIVEFWSSIGELGLIINGQRYLYRDLDMAVIKRFKYLHKTKPGKALNYLKQYASPVRNSNRSEKERMS